MGLRRASVVIGLLAVASLWAPVTLSASPVDDIAKLAAKSPDQPVTARVDFVSGATPSSIADLVFAEKVSLTAFGKQYSSKATYQTFGFSFSDRGPPKEEQLARAMCQTAVGSQPFSDPGPDTPLAPGARSTYIQASVILTASQAKRWRDQPPALVEKIGTMTAMDPAQAKRAREIMKGLFANKVPLVGVARVPSGCEAYMVVKQ